MAQVTRWAGGTGDLPLTADWRLVVLLLFIVCLKKLFVKNVCAFVFV